MNIEMLSGNEKASLFLRHKQSRDVFHLEGWSLSVGCHPSGAAATPSPLS